MLLVLTPTVRRQAYYWWIISNCYEFIPVLSNSLVPGCTGDGAVDTVVIENAGTGYNNKEHTDVPIHWRL